MSAEAPTIIAEAPPVGAAKPSATKPLPSASERGLTTMAEAFKQAASKTPVVEPQREAAPESLPVTETKPAAKPALLDALSEPDPKVEPQKPAAPKPVEAEWKARKAAEWKELTDSMHAAQNEAAELRKQVAEAAKLKSELDALKPKANRAEELERRMEEIAFEKSPAFQRKYVDGKESLVQEAKNLAKDLEMPEDAVAKMLASTGKERLTVIDDAAGGSVAAATAFSNILGRIDQLEREKAGDLAEYKSRLEKMNTEERQKALQVQNEERQMILETFDRVRVKIAEKMPFFKHKDGDDAHNAIVDQNIAFAKALLTGEADMEDIAAAPYLAVSAKSVMRENSSLRAENASLKKALERFNGNTPGVKNGSTSHESSASDKPVGMLDRWKQGV